MFGQNGDIIFLNGYYSALGKLIYMSHSTFLNHERNHFCLRENKHSFLVISFHSLRKIKKSDKVVVTLMENIKVVFKNITRIQGLLNRK